MADPSSTPGPAESAEPPVPPNPVDAEPPVPVPPNPITPDYTDAGVPTFTHVRDRIEERIGRAIGSEELAHESAAGRTVQEQWDAREKAAKERLEQIRKSMHPEAGGAE